MVKIHDLHVREMIPLEAPAELKRELPASERAIRTVAEGRETVCRILHREDRRLLAVVGPCSIHDPAAALEYARRLDALRRELSKQLYVMMRVYFEKPRTTVGWKGLISDPYLDGSENMKAGLRLARGLLLEINEMGLPAGTELLDPITPQYIADLVSWASIGARTTESQTHREMASGLSMPVGFKNNTEGNLQVAVNAMSSARHPHSFLGIDQDGRTCLVRTAGNPYGHLVLRGADDRPNYHPEDLEQAGALLRSAGLEEVVLVDCSHGNSGKQCARQERVWQDVVRQRVSGSDFIIGMMCESNLEEGSQKTSADRSSLRYGVSITDQCVNWETTERMLRYAYDRMDRP